jgi:hypothetical protein
MGHCEFMGSNGNVVMFDEVCILRIFHWMSNMDGYT